MGIQALNDRDLQRLGRIHTVKEAQNAFDIARNTFDRVSFDLIFARQDQSLDAWRSELSEAVASIGMARAIAVTMNCATVFLLMGYPLVRVMRKYRSLRYAVIPALPPVVRPRPGARSAWHRCRCFVHAKG